MEKPTIPAVNDGTGDEMASILQQMGGSAPAHFVDDPVAFIEEQRQAEGNPFGFVGEEDEEAAGEVAPAPKVEEAFDDDEEEPIEEEEEEENELDPTSELQQAIATIQRLEGKVQELEGQIKAPEVKPKREYRLEPVEYVNADNLDDLMSDPKQLNNVLNQIRQEAVQIAIETTMAQAPEELVPVISEQLYYNRLATKFYDSNPDLLNHKEACVKTWSKLKQDNPGLSAVKIYGLLGPAVRKELKLQKPKAQGTPPPPPARSRTRSTQPKTGNGLRTQAQQVAELL